MLMTKKKKEYDLKLRSKAKQNLHEIANEIFDKYMNRISCIKIASLKLIFFMANFHSEMKNNCMFKEYHGPTRGKDCQYVGFFDNTYNIRVFDNFYTDDRKLMFLNVDPAKIIPIRTEESYTLIDKNSDFTVAKLMWQKSDIYDAKTLAFLHEESRLGGLGGEYVVVSNINHNMFSLEINNINNDVTPDIVYMNTPMAGLFKLGNDGITNYSFIHKIIKYILENGIGQRNETIGNETIGNDVLIDDHNELFIPPQRFKIILSSINIHMTGVAGGGFQKKYNKYKNKVDECEKMIRNKLNISNNNI